MKKPEQPGEHKDTLSWWQRFSFFRLLRTVFLAFTALEIGVVAILLLLSSLHKKRKSGNFPRIHLKDARLRENMLRVYGSGKELYQSMFDAIDTAKHTIYLETYIWKDDAVGRKFKEHLARKAAQGVAVYVIFDSFGNLVVPRAFKAPESFHPHIRVLEYQSIRRIRHLIDPRHYALDHRKLLVVDGRTAFIGGFNIGELYEMTWRDTHLRIIGVAAAELAQSFVDFWNRACAPKDRLERRYVREFDPTISFHNNDALRLTFPIRDMYIKNIERAQVSIFLSNAYFVPDHVLLNALKSAAGRGVDVRILVPLVSNHVIADWVSHVYYTDALTAGIRLFGYKPTMLHAKTCTIDGIWSTIGTANLDRLSSIGNFEINVEIFSVDLAARMEELFASDCSAAEELTLANWQSRPWYRKVSERILAPLRFIL